MELIQLRVLAHQGIPPGREALHLLQGGLQRRPHFLTAGFVEEGLRFLTHRLHLRQDRGNRLRVPLDHRKGVGAANLPRLGHQRLGRANPLQPPFRVAQVRCRQLLFHVLILQLDQLSQIFQ